MLKRLRLKIKKQRRARRNEEISKCRNKLEYLQTAKKEIGKKPATKIHTKQELFLEKIQHKQ